MNVIPVEFQMTSSLNQDTKLVSGELKKWTGELPKCFQRYLPSKPIHLPY
jgi:glyceraldehyde-3-phosphate dehydrogenase (NADP+)